MSFRIDPFQGISTDNYCKVRSIDAFPYHKDSIFTCQAVLTARYQLKFGETLYLRGQNDATTGLFFKAKSEGFFNEFLNWNTGIPLKNCGPDEWSIPVELCVVGLIKKVAFKFFINDDENRQETGQPHGFFDFLLMTISSPKFIYTYSRSTDSFASQCDENQYTGTTGSSFFGQTYGADPFSNQSHSFNPPSGNFYPNIDDFRYHTGPQSYTAGGVDPVLDEKQIKRAELEGYIGYFKNDLCSLNHSFGVWARENHPDKVGTQNIEHFKKVSALRDEYKTLMGW